MCTLSHPVSEERTHQGRKEGYSWVVSSGDGVVGGRTRIVSSTVFLSKSELGRWGGRTNSVEQAKRIYCISVRSKQRGADIGWAFMASATDKEKGRVQTTSGAKMHAVSFHALREALPPVYPARICCMYCLVCARSVQWTSLIKWHCFICFFRLLYIYITHQAIAGFCPF